MIISYDNLIVRLWLNGAIMPHSQTNLLDKASIDTMVDEKGLPPIPHDYWVDRLGFQQPDPVTDFRSGGVLSLAMMVHVVEACPAVHERFVAPSGDASVMPFAITSINVTDMIAKFCMLAKSIDRMDALLSQKPFWRMFADPNSILALQELSLDMMADVVVELGKERKIPGYKAMDDTNHSMHNRSDDDAGKVSHSMVLYYNTTVSSHQTTHCALSPNILGHRVRLLNHFRAHRKACRKRFIRFWTQVS